MYTVDRKLDVCSVLNSGFSFIVSSSPVQNFAERTVMTVIHVMLRRGELQHRLQRKVLLRVR